MRDPEQHFLAAFMLVLGILIGVAAGPIAMADPEDAASGPDAPTEPEEPPAKPAPSASAVEPEPAAATLSGLEVYNEICVSCHAPPGVGGAPALGDSDAWAARIARGRDTLIDHALHGYSGSAGIMPAKGGRLDLSDEEIIAAVGYIVEQAAQ